MTPVILLVACGVVASQPAVSQTTAYEELIRLYRSGEIDRAIAKVSTLPEPEGRIRQRMEWIRMAQKQAREADLHAALLLHTEIAFHQLEDALPVIGGYPPPPSFMRQLSIIDRIHATLRTSNPRSPFLRRWYLLWEALRQSNVLVLYPEKADFLEVGLDTFPDDGELLLAMGSRHEMRWWHWPDNGHRDVDGNMGSGVGLLRTARRYLEKSVTVDPKNTEAHMRFARVLLLLGELDKAAAELKVLQAASEGPAFQYLGLLFEGELHERRRDPAAAANAYERAAALVGVPQAARLARARLAHATGDRKQAVNSVVMAMAAPLTQADPWWWYIRGQSWRIDFYLAAARKAVRQ